MEEMVVSRMGFIFLIVIGLGLTLVVALVVMAVAAATRNKRGGVPAPSVPPPARPSEQQQEIRTQVLQELSEGKITREEAEQKMAATQPPAP